MYEENVDEKTRDLNRAWQSLVEEIQAIMYYGERISASKNKKLIEILKHNRDDEKEHASLLLEWLRRNDPEFEKELKEILFSSKEFEDLWD